MIGVGTSERSGPLGVWALNREWVGLEIPIESQAGLDTFEFFYAPNLGSYVMNVGNPSMKSASIFHLTIVSAIHVELYERFAINTHIAIFSVYLSVRNLRLYKSRHASR